MNDYVRPHAFRAASVTVAEVLIAETIGVGVRRSGIQTARTPAQVVRAGVNTDDHLNVVCRRLDDKVFQSLTSIILTHGLVVFQDIRAGTLRIVGIEGLRSNGQRAEERRVGKAV